jgi:5'-methylthioadenosine phosphorylase
MPRTAGIEQSMTQLAIAIIGGTGVGDQLAGQAKGENFYPDTPFGPPSAPLVKTCADGLTLVFLSRHGDGHNIPPTAVPYRANIWALKSLGVTHILATGAVGSLREEIRPRDLVIPDQVIDRTYARIGTFFDNPGIAAHVEFAEPFCPTLRRRLLDQAGLIDASVHDGGTYVCMEGPAFSTVAESRMHRSWGGDLIGMTCMPEAKLAREAEMCYAHISLPTDYDCWRPHDPGKDKRELLREIMSHAQAATQRSIELIRATLKSIAATPPADCPCQHALDLAVWTNRKMIKPETRERFKLLMGARLGE